MSELSKIGKVIRSLAFTQNELADSLRTELGSLNMTFTEKIATAVFGRELAADYMSKITSAARIPGLCTLLSERSDDSAGEEFRTQMADLIAEDIRFVTATEDTPVFVSAVLDGLVSPGDITCEEDDDIVVIRSDEKDIRLYNRLRLLEQIVPYRIGG